MSTLEFVDRFSW